MSLRFFVDSPIGSQGLVTLTGGEAHHLTHVLRGTVGSEVVLFDGSGAEYVARIMRTGRRQVELELLRRSDVDRELERTLVLGVALPKGERQSWLVEKAVELGVERLVPLQTARAVALAAAKVLARLRRAVIEGSKQCGRNRLMQIDGPINITEYLRQAPREAQRWFVHPAHSRGLPAAVFPAIPPSTQTPIYLAIGPEGGFTDEETAEAIDAGWRLVPLGARTLRVETAAVALVSLVSLSSLSSLASLADEQSRPPPLD